MNRQDHHPLHHANIHIANVKPAPHLAILNHHLARSTSRKFKSVNLTLNPTISSNKSELQYDELRKKHSETIEVTKQHEIYFNRTKKYNYMKQIIDKYFQENKKEKCTVKGINPEIALQKNLRTLIPKINKQREEKEEERSDLQEEKGKNRQLLNKRKNKTSILKEEEEELHNSLDSSKNANEKPSEELLPKALSFSSTKAINLPPIDEMLEDKDDQIHDFQYESLSVLNDSAIDTLKEDRIPLLDNEIYLVEMAVINGKMHHRIKTFKEKGQEILKRQLRAFSLGVESVWIEYRYDPRCLISAPSKSLKELLFKVKRVDADSKFFTLKPRKYYKRLMANDCEELLRMVREFCEFMKKFEGKILNNKISTANLFIGKNENLRLGEWGFSSFKETHLIQNMEFQNRIEPIVKSQGEWFVPPEYLAPEIIKAIVFGEDVDLMSYGSASDIWSFGVALLEILTLIPVWIPQKCTIFGKAMQPRSGLLSIGDRDLKKLLKREEKLSYLSSKLIEQDFSEEHFNSKILELISKCLECTPEKRPTYSEICQLLK